MQQDIDSLSYQLEEIAESIAKLNQLKRETEDKIIELIGTKSEGTTTSKSKFYKASTVAKVTRTFDKGFKPADLIAVLGEELASKVVRVKYEPVTSELRNLTEEQMIAISDFMTAKPAKTSIKIERIEQEAQA